MVEQCRQWIAPFSNKAMGKKFHLARFTPKTSSACNSHRTISAFTGRGCPWQEAIPPPRRWLIHSRLDFEGPALADLWRIYLNYSRYPLHFQYTL